MAGWTLGLTGIIAAAALFTVWLARDTVKIAKAAREADERDRRLRQLRSIGQLVEGVRSNAMSHASWDDYWRCAEHEQLAQALIGVDPPMPACGALADMSTARESANGAEAAREEVQAALRGAGLVREKSAAVRRKSARGRPTVPSDNQR